MNFRKSFLAAAYAAALVAPAVSFASSEFHPANGEIGYTQHPDHVAKSSLSRDQVTAEVEAARKAGWLYSANRTGIFPMKNQGAAKTRDQVINELRNETAAERRTRMEQNTGG